MGVCVCVCVLQVCRAALPLLLSPSILSTSSTSRQHSTVVNHDISPDSGHRELSSDSLATSNTQSDVNAQSELSSWHSALAGYQERSTRNSIMSSQTCPVIASHHAAGDGLLQSHDATRFLLQSHHSVGEGLPQSHDATRSHHATGAILLQSHHSAGEGLFQSHDTVGPGLQSHDSTGSSFQSHHSVVSGFLESHHATGTGLPHSHNSIAPGLLQSHDATGFGLLQSPTSSTSRVPDPTSQHSFMSDVSDYCGQVLQNASLQSCRIVLTPNSKATLGAVDKSFSPDDAQLFANEDSTLGGEEGISFLDDSDLLAHSISDLQHH